MGSAQNYKVKMAGFGGYKIDSVLPGWAVARAGNVPEMVERGIVEPTDLPVNVDVRVPEPKVSTDPSPDLVGELNRLRKENEALAESNKSLLASRDQYHANSRAKDAQLGEQTVMIEHLKAACADHQTRIDALEAEGASLKADLEAATAPAPKKDKKPAPVAA